MQSSQVFFQRINLTETFEARKHGKTLQQIQCNSLDALFVVALGGQIGRSAESNEPLIRTTERMLRVSLHPYAVPRKDGTEAIDFKDLSRGDQYRVQGYQHGLTSLQKASGLDLEHPNLLIAVIQETETIPVELFTVWLCSRDAIGGVYVESEFGAELADGKVTTIVDPGAQDDQKGLLRYSFSRISQKGKAKVPQLKMDPKWLANKLRVGIIETDGRRTKPIEAFVEEKLRIRRTPKQDE